MNRANSVSRAVTPVGALARGAVAGVVGTAAMDLWLFAQYKRGDGDERFADWEFSSQIVDWMSAPAPAQVGRRLIEGLFERKVPDERARLVNNVTHWAYGVLAAAQFGLVGCSLREPKVRYGIPFGAAIWASSYALLPLAGLYKQIWEYDGKTLAKDLTAHLVYGLSAATALRQLLPRGPQP